MLEGSLVVDATGRGSKLPDWLRAAGVAGVAETEIDARMVYTSAFARFRKPLPRGWKVLFVQGLAGRINRGVAIGPVEGGRTLVSVATAAGEPAPDDTSGFAAFGRTLRGPFAGDLFEDAEWLTPARSTRSTANRKRHYGDIAMPRGLLVMGDALCAFNPVFGQGITVAAIQADALAGLLRRHGPNDASLGSRATRRFLRVVAFPWAMATSQDRRLVDPREPSGAQRLSSAYMNRIFGLATTDGDVNLRTSRIFNLSLSPLALYAPRLAARALRAPTPTPEPGPFAHPDANAGIPDAAAPRAAARHTGSDG